MTATVLATPEEEISELAEAVADEYQPDGKIDPEEIADAVEISLSFGEYGEAFDGMLEHKSGRFHIYCNLNRVEHATSPRARFTLCHELGHYFLDSHRNALEAGRVPSHGSICDFESRNPVEREADHFASNLLLPTSRFVAAAKRTSVGLGGVLSLSNRFGASVTSTAVRYVKMGLSPCAVVKWSSSGYAWKWISNDLHRAGYRKTIETTDAIPAGSRRMSR